VTETLSAYGQRIIPEGYMESDIGYHDPFNGELIYDLVPTPPASTVVPKREVVPAPGTSDESILQDRDLDGAFQTELVAFYKDAVGALIRARGLKFGFGPDDLNADGEPLPLAVAQALARAAESFGQLLAK
jgi:hypothetical protein